MLQHFVFLKYCDARALSGTVGGIQRLEIGRDEVYDARSWDLMLIMEFTSIEER